MLKAVFYIPIDISPGVTAPYQLDKAMVIQLNGNLDAEGKDKVWCMPGCPPGWSQNMASMQMKPKNLRTLQSLIMKTWPN